MAGSLTIRCGCDSICRQSMTIREGNNKVRLETAIQGNIILSCSDVVQLRDWLDKFLKKGARKA